MNEKTILSNVIYEGKIIKLTSDEVELENGYKTMREVIHHPGGVGVVAFTKDNKLIMVKQFRYPFHEELLEIPAGKKEVGEDPIITGARELREETGYVGDNLEYLGLMYPTVGYCDEEIHLYVTHNCEFKAQDLDEGEFVSVELYELSDIRRMLQNGEIKDGKTQVALFMYLDKIHR